MPTLEEILNENLGLVEQPKQEKVASVAELDEIEKLAAEIGLVETGSQLEPTSETKEAQMTMSSLYDELFPEDSGLGKVASVSDEVEQTEEEKVAAAYESALGARAFDYFQERVDERITKLAAEAISHGAEHPQQLPNNKKGDNDAIDTAPESAGDLKAENKPESVGKYEDRSSQIKAAAVRKYLIASMIEE